MGKLKTVKLKEDTYKALWDIMVKGETYDNVVSRLILEHRGLTKKEASP